jgi:hypothetical protein
MSLINDALKKVSQAERGKPQAAPVDFETQAMQPAVYERRSNNLVWISVALLAVAIVVATVVFAKQRQTPVTSTIVPTVAAETAKASPAEAKPAATPVAAEAPKAQALEVAATATNTISPATPAPAAQAALTPAQPAPAPAPVATLPTFRLKGILFTSNPTALINEASVHVGGEVDGATVTKIESTTVALDYEGKSITLKLGAK